MKKHFFYVSLLYFFSLIYISCGSSSDDNRLEVDKKDLNTCHIYTTDCDSEGDNCTDYYYFGCFNGEYNCAIIVQDSTFETTGAISVEPEYKLSRLINFNSADFFFEIYANTENDYYFIKIEEGYIKYQNADYFVKNGVGYRTEDSIFIKIMAVNSLNDTIFALFNSAKK